MFNAELFALFGVSVRTGALSPPCSRLQCCVSNSVCVCCRKLRRGDKFTDTRFLRSPIFKQTQASRRSLQRREIYNESFVGCR